MIAIKVKSKKDFNEVWYNETGDKMQIEQMMKKLNYEKPTPIQEMLFQKMKSKKHLVALAPTGTGKTHAYLLPILEAIDFNLLSVQQMSLCSKWKKC